MKRILSIFSLLAAFCLLAPVGASAKADGDLNARLELAEKLVQSEALSKVQNQVLKTLGGQMINLMVSKNPSKEKEIRQLMEKILTEMAARKSEINKEVGKLYAHHFTLDELREIHAFKQSPVGKKLDSKLPVITQQSMVIAQKWAQQLSRDVIERVRKEAKQHGFDL